MLLPNLFLPGAGKSGTTSMHYYLNQHPEIIMSLDKEPAYFCRSDKSLDDYRFLFPENALQYRYRGEASAIYMNQPDVPSKIKEFCKDPKIIFVLRNPIDRAWSHYNWQHIKYPYEQRSFRDAFGDSVEKMQVPIWKPGIRNFNYYTEGCYSKPIKRYIDTFGRNNVLIVQSEALFSDLLPTVNEVFRFLDLPELNHIDHKVLNKTTKFRSIRFVEMHIWLSRNIGKLVKRYLPEKYFAYLKRANTYINEKMLIKILEKETKIPSIALSDRSWVAQYYADDVDELRRITGISFCSWNNDFPR